MLATFKEIISDHIRFRKQLLKLARNDLIKQYRGAAFGWAWAIIKPVITIFVYWFGFAIGLRAGHDMNGYPFFLWLIAGFIPWFYMSEVILQGASSIRNYRFLVQRIKYPVDTIPTFISLSHMFVNIIMQLIMIIIFWGNGYPPKIYYLEIPLLILLTLAFFTAWSLFAGMLSAMSVDFLNLVRSMIIALMWLSGILYDVNRIQIGWLRKFMLFNPVTLIVNAYRNVFIYDKWIWETPAELRNLLIAIAVMWILAVWAYKKLKKTIPDVL